MCQHQETFVSSFFICVCDIKYPVNTITRVGQNVRIEEQSTSGGCTLLSILWRREGFYSPGGEMQHDLPEASNWPCSKGQS